MARSCGRRSVRARCVGVLLADTQGRLLADVVDDTVSVLDGRRTAARLRELEVETTPSTPPGLLEAVIARLRVASGTKAERAALGGGNCSCASRAAVSAAPESAIGKHGVLSLGATAAVTEWTTAERAHAARDIARHAQRRGGERCLGVVVTLLG